VRKQLRNFQDAAEYLKTEAPTGVKGSPTLDKILTFLDGVGKFTKFAGGGIVSDIAGAGIKKGYETVQAAETLRSAKSTPVDDAAKAAAKEKPRARNVKAAKRAAPFVLRSPPPETYGGQQ
jgi:hypothetical protein